MSKEITNPFESLHNAMVFACKDWSNDEKDAWVYGIVAGWESEDKEANENIFQDFNKSFGWSRETWDRLKLLHTGFLNYKEISIHKDNSLKIHVVVGKTPYDGDEILEAFKNKEDAERCKEKKMLVLEHNRKKKNWFYEFENFYIKEVEVK